MASFLYFLPGEQRSELIGEGHKLNRKTLAKWGLDKVLADCTVHPDHLLINAQPTGPGGDRGLLIYPKPLDGKDPPSWKFAPPSQEWLQSQSGRWIGWFKDAPPGPEDLQRRDAIVTQYTISDELDRRWAMITARSGPGNDGLLPCNYLFDECDPSRLISVTKAKYQHLWELSEKVYEHFSSVFHQELAAGCQRMSEAELSHAVLTILAVNYRVGPLELNALYHCGVPFHDDAIVSKILMLFLGMPLLEDFEQWLTARDEKKTPSPAESCTSACSGSADCIAPTDLAATPSKSPAA